MIIFIRKYHGYQSLSDEEIINTVVDIQPLNNNKNDVSEDITDRHLPDLHIVMHSACWKMQPLTARPPDAL